MDGDYVVCEQTQVANAGDIVVALVGGDEATLKRLPRRSGKIRCSQRIQKWRRLWLRLTTLDQGRVIGVRKY
jgi:repressor LexA